MKMIIKYLGFLVVTFVLVTPVHGQSSFGISAGTKLIAEKDLRFPENLTITSLKQKSVGYNIGFYYETGGTSFYLRPQLGFTQHNGVASNVEYSESSLELPISFGYKVLPIFSFFGGPSFHYYLNKSLKGTKLRDIKENYTYGLHLGAQLHLGKISIQLRYERGLKKEEIEFLDNNNINLGTLDSKPDYLILGLNLELKRPYPRYIR